MPISELRLFFLLEQPLSQAVPAPLPPDLSRQTIESSLWSASEKDRLRQHAAYLEVRQPIGNDPIDTFLRMYREALAVPGIIGIANPLAHTAHHICWVERLFADGLDRVARETPPLHLWTGLLPVEVEVSLADLLRERTASLWLRTVGYGQFGLPDLAHPLADLRETAWVHSLFELLFDWMYFRHPLRAGDAIEVPERGHYFVEELMPEVLALLEWKAENGSF